MGEVVTTGVVVSSGPGVGSVSVVAVAIGIVTSGTTVGETSGKITILDVILSAAGVIVPPDT